MPEFFQPKTARALLMDSAKLHAANFVRLSLVLSLPWAVAGSLLSLVPEDGGIVQDLIRLAAMLIVAVVLVSADMVAAARIASERPLDFTVYRQAWNSPLGTLLKVALLVLAVGAALTFLLYIGITIAGDFRLHPGPGIFYALGASLWVLGIAWLMFVPPIVVIERLGTAELFARQRTLMHGFYIRNMAVIIVALLLPELASSILHWIFGETGSILQSAAGTVIAVALHPFPAIVLMLIYLDMRVRKEDYNAARFSAEMEAAPQPRPA